MDPKINYNGETGENLSEFTTLEKNQKLHSITSIEKLAAPSINQYSDDSTRNSSESTLKASSKSMLDYKINVDEIITDRDAGQNELETQLRVDETDVPEVVSKASLSKRKKTKRPKTSKRIVNMRKIKFKNNAKNNISSNLNKYVNTKEQSSKGNDIQRKLYSASISTVVSRSRILKKAVSKKQLLESSDSLTDTDSLQTPSSINRSSLSSTSSQNTIVLKDVSSHESHSYVILRSSPTKVINMKPINELEKNVEDKDEKNKDYEVNDSLETLSNQNIDTKDYENEEQKSPTISERFPSFQSKVVEVAYVQLSKKKFSDINQTSKVSNRGSINNSIVYSALPTKSEKEIVSKTNNVLTTLDGTVDLDNSHTLLESSLESASTLSTPNISMLSTSNYSTYVIAQTSSDFQKSSYSITSCTSNTDVGEKEFNSNIFQNKQPNTELKKTEVLIADTKNHITIPNLCEDSKITTEKKDICIDIDLEIQDKILNNFPKCDNNHNKDKPIPASQKEFARYASRNIHNLESHAIPDKSKNLFLTSKKDENRINLDDVYPGTIPELWERLVRIIEATIRRLETSLTDKIINQIKTLLSKYNLPITQEIPLEERIPTNCSELNQNKVTEEDKRIMAKHRSLQCEIIQNQTIDLLVNKLSMIKPIIPGMSSNSLIKALKDQDIFKDCLEVLKPPTAKSTITDIDEKLEAATVSTEVANITQSMYSLKKYLILWNSFVIFFRENLFVITSVPTFFILMLVIYGLIYVIV